MTKTQTLKRHEKIRRPSQYKAIISRGRRIQGGVFVLYLRRIEAGDKDAASKLGIVVSKRVLRRAHNRARVKRILREFFRKNKAGFKFPASIVFRLVKQPKSFTYKKIENDCFVLLRRCGIM